MGGWRAPNLVSPWWGLRGFSYNTAHCGNNKENQDTAYLMGIPGVLAGGVARFRERARAGGEDARGSLRGS